MSDQKLPISMSAGGDNTVHIHCVFIEQQKAYAACLHIQNLYKTDPDNVLYSDCFRGIERDRCAAVGMRKEEVEAGKALHYEPQSDANILISKHKDSPEYARGWNRTGGKIDDLPSKPMNSTPSYTKPKPVEKSGQYDAMDLSKVVTEMAAEETKVVETKAIAIKPVRVRPEPTKRIAPKPMPGESMLQMAKRIMNERKEASV
jgi:hypothetical protein